MRPCIRRGSRSFFAGHGLCEQEQTSCPTCIVVYMFGSRQPHSVGGCALIVNLDCGVEAFLDSCNIFRKLPKGAHCSARLTEEMNQRHARGLENRQSHSVDGSLMVAMSSPQSPPPVNPNYQMEALTGYVKAAPLPLNSRPNVSNTDVKSLTLGIVNRRAGGYGITAATALHKFRLRTLVAEAGGLPERSLCTRCLPEGSWCSFLDDDVCHIHKPDYLSLHELVMLAFLTALQRRVHLWGLNTSSCPAPSAW